VLGTFAKIQAESRFTDWADIGNDLPEAALEADLLQSA
jgi:hypothetical protein